MKLSLNWIFDHINGDWRNINLAEFIDKFNRTTAAIEHYYPFDMVVDHLSMVQVKEVFEKHVVVFSPEWQKTLELPKRLDAGVGKLFLIKSSEQTGYAWTTLADFGASAKQGLLPAIFCPVRQRSGVWKKYIEKHDYILELDNPSITHRPDLWGARGIARECAALLGLKLRTISGFLHDVEIQEVSGAQYVAKDSDRFSIINDAPLACNRFAGLTISGITDNGCNVWLAHRLCKVDQRPLGALVDAANYVMLDLGQPMHTFDAQKITSKTIMPRMARAGEELALLDGTKLTLCPHDLVISDGQKPLALAGIMGGAATAVDEQTTNVFVESANFNSTAIRGASSRYFIRTDASARFEKSLDPNQITDAIKRMLKLLANAGAPHTILGPIVALGEPFKPYQITVSHDMIEQRLGVTIASARVLALLRSIGFVVAKKKKEYVVEAPSFRGTKGVTIAQDIVEEVGRLMGYDTIDYRMPQWPMKPSDTRSIMSVRALKQHLAFALNMHEVSNYPFFDERFLSEIKWAPEHAVRAKNPLSTNVTRLVTSLVPHLYLNVQQNSHKHEQMRFFECARVWDQSDGMHTTERKVCAGVLWHTKEKQNFYAGKRELSTLFDALGVTVSWAKVDQRPAAWFDINQTARLEINGAVVGYAGMSDRAFAREIPGCGFLFELVLNELLACACQQKRFKPLCKYPYVYLDISMLVSLEYTVQQLEELIKKSDEKIYDVELVDMFFKDEWRDQRSLTFRYYMRDQEATLVKEAIDDINARVLAAIAQTGAQIR